jgi:hypothetical protein
MEILKYFDIERKDKFIIYRLRPGMEDTFADELTVTFRRCYIDDSKLSYVAAKNQMSQDKFLEKYVIPDIGNVKSGDFGEMLSFFAMLENYLTKGFRFTGPFKWLWKDRNKPSPYTDAVSFYMEKPPAPSPEDTIVTIESKMKAVKSNAHRIQEAIDGANKDRLSRLSATLSWLEEKYAREGDIDNRKLVERFNDPSTYGPYKQVSKAFTILDSTFEAAELCQSVCNTDGLVLIIFSLANLKQIYERNRLNMFNSVKL